MWNYMYAAPWLIYDREFEDSERDRITHHKKTKQCPPTWRRSWTGEERMVEDKTRSLKPERQPQNIFWGERMGSVAESGWRGWLLCGRARQCVSTAL